MSSAALGVFSRALSSCLRDVKISPHTFSMGSAANTLAAAAAEECNPRETVETALQTCTFDGKVSEKKSSELLQAAAVQGRRFRGWYPAHHFSVVEGNLCLLDAPADFNRLSQHLVRCVTVSDSRDKRRGRNWPDF